MGSNDGDEGAVLLKKSIYAVDSGTHTAIWNLAWVEINSEGNAFLEFINDEISFH